jgi:hypothetical protein
LSFPKYGDADGKGPLGIPGKRREDILKRIRVASNGEVYKEKEVYRLVETLLAFQQRTVLNGAKKCTYRNLAC